MPFMEGVQIFVLFPSAVGLRYKQKSIFLPIHPTDYFLIVTFFTNAAVNEKGQHSAYLKAVVQYQYGSSSVAFWDFELAF